MGTTLSGSSHFVSGKLLRWWRQATVIMAGCIFHFHRACAFCCYFCNPSLSESAFYNFILVLSFRFFLSVNLPGRSVTENTVWFFTCDQYFCCMEHFRLFSFPVPRNILRNFRLHFFPFLNSTFQWTTGVFFRLTDRSDLTPFAQPLTLPLRKPEGLTDPVLYSAKSLSPSPLLQSNLLSLTWYVKDTSLTASNANNFGSLFQHYINKSY